VGARLDRSGAVLEVERAAVEATLVVPASKSGTTIEMASHLERFLERLRRRARDAAGRYVLPITDPGSGLDAAAADEGFRGVVHGQPDVGGRFSALTPFGLLPGGAARDGPRHPPRRRPGAMLAAARSIVDPDENAPAMLGAAMAAGAARAATS
jgi:glucose-6-phosphate isomerase